MAKKKISIRVSPEYAQARLDHFLAGALTQELGLPISKARARGLILAGAVYLNRARVRIASKALIPGAVVEIWWDERENPAPVVRWEMAPSDILYRDEFLVVLSKPSGVPTQPSVDEARSNVFRSLGDFLKKENPAIDPYVGLHHRLDRDTSGAILFTLKKEANKRIADQFAEKSIQKTYLALVEKSAMKGNLPDRFSVQNFLGKVSRTGESRFGSVRSGGDRAETDFQVLEQNSSYALILAFPRTGRTHQIRVHLSEKGFPIVGDVFYGARPTNYSRFMLHAWRLDLKHPISGLPLSVQSPLPEVFQTAIHDAGWPKSEQDRILKKNIKSH